MLLPLSPLSEELSFVPKSIATRQRITPGIGPPPLLPANTAETLKQDEGKNDGSTLSESANMWLDVKGGKWKMGSDI